MLDPNIVPVGAQEMARLARDAGRMRAAAAATAAAKAGAAA
jgi:hypothetical protein